MIGVHERGEKHCLAIEDDVRESTQSWREVLLKLTSRGMSVPELAIGDGAMGFWAALEEVYPETRQQRGANTAGLKLVNREQKTRIKIRQCKYLNNIIEQDHRRIKRVTWPMLGFKNFYAAQCTLAGIEVMAMIKKGPMKIQVSHEPSFAEQFYMLVA